jgi:hypothetical protein
MKLSRSLLLAGAALGCAGAALAHHSFAQFDSSRQILVEGQVTNWSYASPHSWLYIDAPNEKGEIQKWSFEGAAPIHATRQGVTGNTYKKGEKVRVIMSPLRDGRPAGALCFVVKEDGTITQPNDGTCNAAQVIERWKTRGWLESGKHLDMHPVAD